MSRYQLIITLQSDLCVADGGAWNSAIDVDVCQDEYGFPYIPAKRIRGCLREAALELNDWGENIPIATLFGQSGNIENGAKVRITNAYLRNYSELVQEVLNHNGYEIYHPQNVLGIYTYVRTQTALDQETGAADATSLRSLRVIKKGLQFVADVETEENIEHLMLCVQNFSSLGLARTRGLGEISAELVKVEEAHKTSSQKRKSERRIYYSLQLLEPVVCKSVRRGQEESLDYIDGAKILGMILNRAKKSSKGAQVILEDKSLVFSDAFVAVDGKRGVEAPGFLYSIKNNSTEYVNKLYGDETVVREDEQLNAMKHCYVVLQQDVLRKKNVKMEERYHHKRPEDKSIGRAVKGGNENGEFYQLSSIAAGQRLMGFIDGDKEILDYIQELVEQESNCYIGYGNHSEYGLCRMAIDYTHEEQEKAVSVKKFALTLCSPTIIYNDKATYSTSVSDLVEEICCAIGIEKAEVKVSETYLKYDFVGGFNVSWGMRKPTIAVFDKGTTIVLELDHETELVCNESAFLGERNLEGYGEYSICEILDTGVARGRIISGESDKNASTKDFLSLKLLELGGKIADDLFEAFLEERAICTVNEKIKCDESYRSTVSNMLLMISTAKEYEDVKRAIIKRYNKAGEKKNKLEKANNIIAVVDKALEEMEKTFQTEYHLADFTYKKGDYKLAFLHSVLVAIKYNIRGSKSRKVGE